MEFKYSTTVDHSMVTVIVSCGALVLKYLRVLAYISALRSIYINKNRTSLSHI